MKKRTYSGPPRYLDYTGEYEVWDTLSDRRKIEIARERVAAMPAAFARDDQYQVSVFHELVKIKQGWELTLERLEAKHGTIGAHSPLNLQGESNHDT